MQRTAHFHVSDIMNTVVSKGKEEAQLDEDGRFFVHHFPDYDVAGAPKKAEMLKEETRKALYAGLERIAELISRSYTPSEAEHDESIYTGAAGVAIALERAERAGVSLRHSSLEYLNAALKRAYRRSSRITFHIGPCGPLALAVGRSDIDQRERNRALRELKAYAEDVIEDCDSNEVLYGRAGYLLALQHVQSSVPNDEDVPKLIEAVIGAIISAGRVLGSRERPLMYEWHGKRYWGAAHGVTGILYAILGSAHVLEAHPSWKQDVLQTIGFFVDAFMSNGSGLFSSREDGSHKLMQWCHGNPGLVLLLCRAYSLFSDRKYLVAAERASEQLWERGLLHKGTGLCHGIAGNAYCFLALFHVTGDDKYLYRALKFTFACLSDAFRSAMRTPDAPYSLYEGIGGLSCLLSDLLRPHEAQFPAFA